MSENEGVKLIRNDKITFKINSQIKDLVRELCNEREVNMTDLLNQLIDLELAKSGKRLIITVSSE